jgi:hypothetical protein
MKPNQTETLYQCQIACVHQIPEKTRFSDILRHVVLKSIWAAYRRIKFVFRSIQNLMTKSTERTSDIAKTKLAPGDNVRVKAKEQIRATLNAWDELKGCGFMDEMLVYCGTTQKVYKRVEKFIDERDYRLKRANGVVLLENVLCQGTNRIGSCDRSCFFFWREEWLEKI